MSYFSKPIDVTMEQRYADLYMVPHRRANGNRPQPPTSTPIVNGEERRNVFLSGVAPKLGNYELREILFNRVAPPLDPWSLDHLKNKQTGHNKGSVFINFNTVEDAARAIDFFNNGGEHQLSGVRAQYKRVAPGSPRSRSPEQQNADQPMSLPVNKPWAPPYNQPFYQPAKHVSQPINQHVNQPFYQTVNLQVNQVSIPTPTLEQLKLAEFKPFPDPVTPASPILDPTVDTPGNYDYEPVWEAVDEVFDIESMSDLTWVVATNVDLYTQDSLSAMFPYLDEEDWLGTGHTRRDDSVEATVQDLYLRWGCFDLKL